MRTSPLMLACLLAAPSFAARPAVKGLAREEAAARAARVSGVAYRLQFAVGLDEKDFTGVSEISFGLKGAREPLTIDFAEGRPGRVTANGVEVPVDYNGRFITVPGSALREGANTVRVDYAHPYSTTGSGLYRFKDPADGAVYLYSDFEPYDANLMFPCFDQPDLKAGFSVEVVAPEDWLVVSAARPERVLPAGPGRRRWVFPATKPFSTYVFSLHAGPYVEWRDSFEGLPLGLYARRSLARFVDAEEWFAVTKQGLGFFNGYFDYPYPFGKYDQVLVPDFNSGAMENVGSVTFSERNAPRSRPTPAERLDRADVILHEMAHMWFGDLVTMRWWDDLWLNESFASYMSAVAVDAATEFRDAWLDFNLGTKQWAYWEDQLVTTHPIEAVVPDTEQAFANFDGITYGKGASALKQLATFLGPERFRDGARLYFKRHAFRNARRADFIAALAEASGRSLDAWTPEWLQTAGVNTVSADYACAAGRITRFELVQEAPPGQPTLRRHAAKVALLGGSGLAAEVLDAAYAGPRTALPAAVGRPCPELVLPNYDDHDFVKVRLDARSLAAAKARLSELPRALDRSMLWMALWEMVQHAEFGPGEYAELVVRHLPAETNFQLQAKVAETVYGRRLNSTSLLFFRDESARFEPFFARLLAGAAPGSDAQRLWFDAFVRVARSPAALARLGAFLDGQGLPPGLELDLDRRWGLVAQLSRFAAPGAEARVAAELARDNSRRAQTEAIAARVLAPDGAAKRAWLAELADPGTVKPLAELRAAMRHVFPHEQAEARRAFAKTYYERLPAFAKNRPSEFVSEFAEQLVPALCSASDGKALEEFAAANAGLGAVALKEVRVALQMNARCVKVGARLEKGNINP